MNDKIIYVDHAATTPLDSAVLDSMLPYLKEKYGNASSVYSVGREAKIALDEARETIANAFNANRKEIYFTSSGSEADNWAIKGIFNKCGKSKGHFITSKIEHPAVLETFKYIEKNGGEVTYLPVDEEGLISLTQLEQAIRPDTALISIMFANNEIGTIQPIKEIGEIARKHNVIFHTDAVQAAGAVPIDVEELNIDLMSFSGHKIYGPKGVGCLYIRNGIKIEPLIHGGHQERGRRASTENIPGIVGLAAAVKLATDELDKNAKHISMLRDLTFKLIEERIPHIKINGSREHRLPANVNVSFKFIEGESILLMLDMNGICASSGSACTSGSLDPSHVLLAIGLPHEIAHGSVRISYGKHNTVEDVNYIVDKLEMVIQRLREMSPLWNQ